MPIRFIRNKIADMLKIDKILLGRWKLNDYKATQIKIDMANTDHCGTCTIIESQYIIQEPIKKSDYQANYLKK